jgi:ketosteroid isomerase-like protein
MSRENLELVRGILEDFLAGKSEFDAEGMLTRIVGEDIMDPDIEWDASEAMFDLGGVYRGVEAVRQWWRNWLAAWETTEFEYELVDAGDRVVALIDQRMRGLSTGIAVPLGKYAHVYTLRGGLIVHWKVYRSQSEALAAVGLLEEDARSSS